MSLGMASSGHRRGGAGFGGGEGGSGVELGLVKVSQGTGIMGILGQIGNPFTPSAGYTIRQC